MRKTAKLQLYLTIFSAVLLLISITAGTFAWFSFRTDVNVEPISGNLGETDGSLLISNSPDGPFDKTCELLAKVPQGGLLPISTANLIDFYAAATQNLDGEITSFREMEPGRAAITGTVYLKATKNSCDVFFTREALNFGFDNQVLAALRLGLRITRPGEEPLNLIFKLDDIGNTAAAWGYRTLPEGHEGQVAAGKALDSMVKDPARDLAGYWATTIQENPKTYSVDGKNALFHMTVTGEETIARVDYFVYLEGCDIHCHDREEGTRTGVPQRNLALALGFFGGKE